MDVSNITLEYSVGKEGIRELMIGQVILLNDFQAEVRH